MQICKTYIGSTNRMIKTRLGEHKSSTKQIYRCTDNPNIYFGDETFSRRFSIYGDWENTQWHQTETGFTKNFAAMTDFLDP